MDSFLLRKSAVTSLAVMGNGLFCFLFVLLLSVQVDAAEEGYEADVLKAAHMGDGQSQFALALLYEYGGEKIERNPAKSVTWFKRAARQSVAGGCLYLGLKYEYGTGVKQDYEKAVCWYTCAAVQQWPMAQFFLSRLYERGLGVPASPLTALAWVGLAAESDYPGAEEEFARLKKQTSFNDADRLKEEQRKVLTQKSPLCY